MLNVQKNKEMRLNRFLNVFKIERFLIIIIFFVQVKGEKERFKYEQKMSLLVKSFFCGKYLYLNVGKYFFIVSNFKIFLNITKNPLLKGFKGGY